MPLHEFLKMFQETLESSQPKAPSPTEISAGPENELVELVWENGQIMMQGQSSRAKKNPLSNDFQSQPPGVQDRYTGNAANPKVEKFGALSSAFSDATPSVPLGEMYLDQEDDMVPWLNYPEDETSNKDFCSEISAEISGVTRNEPSSHSSFSSLGKGSLNQMLQHSHIVPDHINASLGAPNAPKVSSSRTGFLNSYMPSQGQTSIPSVGSGVSNVDTNTTSKVSDGLFGDSVQGQASTGGFRSMKIQKQNVGLPGSGSSFLNFTHFSRPAALFRANLEKSDSLAASCSCGIEKMGNEKVSAASSSTPIKSSHVKPCSNSRKEICFNSQPKLVSSKFDLRSSVVTPLEESCHIEQSDALHRDDSMKRPSQASGASTAKEVTDVHKTVEAVVAASSVCSGNCGEGASNDQMHNSKRKNRENDESDSRSEDVEEESMVVKKAHARGGSGSKKSRAAEVHNLSERRRRDRINEKMRALQELIPNCNKADKASMLDEAIEYLKTLQLQVQMMSMGVGLCMPPMMFPTGLQHIHPAHVPHFPPFAGGVGMGMGFGMGMLDMIAGSPRFPIYPVPPIPGAHFPSVLPISASSTFQGIAGTNLQVFGHPNQGLPMSVPRAPLVPLMGQTPLNSAVGLNASRMVVPTEAPSTSQTFKSDNPLQNENSQLIGNADDSISINQTTNQLQATNKDIDQPALATKDDQVAISWDTTHTCKEKKGRGELEGKKSI